MPFSGANFPDTQPGTTERYEFDFVDQGLAIVLVETVTVGGVVTAGEAAVLTLTNPIISGGARTVSYTVLGTDTPATIAAALAALINGDQPLAAAGFSASATGAVASIDYPPQPATTFEQLVSGVQGADPTLILAFAAGTPTGETISAATWTCAVAEVLFGDVDPAPAGHVIGAAIITGSKVATLAGGSGGLAFIAGNRYRLTCTATTTSSQNLTLYSHVNVLLPT